MPCSEQTSIQTSIKSCLSDVFGVTFMCTWQNCAHGRTVLSLDVFSHFPTILTLGKFGDTWRNEADKRREYGMSSEIGSRVYSPSAAPMAAARTARTRAKRWRFTWCVTLMVLTKLGDPVSTVPYRTVLYCRLQGDGFHPTIRVVGYAWLGLR